jgi:hypothetical protein
VCVDTWWRGLRDGDSTDLRTRSSTHDGYICKHQTVVIHFEGKFSLEQNRSYQIPSPPSKLGHGDPSTYLILVIPTSMVTTKTSDGAPIPDSLNVSLLAAHKLSGTTFIVVVTG